MKKRMTIGSLDRVDLLELNLSNVTAKSDNLSHFSKLYCEDIKEVIVRGQKKVNFWISYQESGARLTRKYSFFNYAKSTEHTTDGKKVAQFMIQTTIVLFNQLFVIDFLLVKQYNLSEVVVLGNEFLDEQFILDPKRINLSYDHKNQLRI